MKRDTIVTFRQIQKQLGDGLDRIEASVGRTGFESSKAPTEEPPMNAASGVGDVDKELALKLFVRAMKEIERADTGGGIMTTTSDELGSLLQSFIAQQADDADAILPLPNHGGFEAKFDTHDILGWAGSFFQWWRKLVPHKWLAAPEGITKVTDGDLRIGLLADWGTGLYGAPECAKSIDRDPIPFDILLHLGDVYYSGTKKEIEKRFLPLWPKKARLAHLALNSNHEMYSGGWGYFDTILPRFREMSSAFKQSASYFAVANPHFTLVGLDTGYKDNDLAGDQAAWLERVANESEKAGRKLVIFSHHQPFSAFEGNGDRIVEKLRPMLDQKRIFAWIFGHEHRLVVYDTHPEWDLRGRCIGHGGMPYFRDKLDGASPEETAFYGVGQREKGGIKTPPALVLDGPNPYLGEDRTKYGPNGYVVLELRGPEAFESYRLPDGTAVLERKLT